MMKRPAGSRSPVKQDDVDTVAALVRMLIDGGFEPARIEASLSKSSKPQDLEILAECFSGRHPKSGTRKPPRAA